MNTPESLQVALEDWPGTAAPPRLDEVMASPGYAAMRPAARIKALNQAQRNAANWLREHAPEYGVDFGDVARDMEADFDRRRSEEIRNGLAADMAAGNLSEDTVRQYVKGGTAALDDEMKNYVRTRYGDEADAAGPWQTYKLPLSGADGKGVGFAYVRHAPGKDYVGVSWTVNTKDGKQIKGTEDVSAAEALKPEEEAKQYAERYYGINAGEGADETFGPGPPLPAEITRRVEEYEATPPEARPLVYALKATEAKLRARPEIADRIGQGFWAGLPGQAAKGLLNLGAATVHGPGALFGSTESVKNWQEGTADIAGDIEGQSRLGFAGGTWNNVLKAVSEEALPMAVSMGTGLAAGAVRRGVASSVEKGFMSRMAALELGNAAREAPGVMARTAGWNEMLSAGGRTVPQSLNESLSRGLFGKWLGTAEIEGEMAKQLADRVSNAVAFLPSSTRSGLQNMATTLDAADAARAAGDEAKAQQLEDHAVLNGWAGVGIETLSENMWLNEMLVTRAGRPLSSVATDVLARRMKPGVMSALTQRAKAALANASKAGVQEGTEEIAAGVGGRAWMNEFAAQNQDLLAGVTEEFLTGAVLGAVMGGAKSLAKDGKPAVLNELIQRGLSGDDKAMETLADIRKRAEALKNNLPGKTPSAGVKPQGAPAPGTVAEPGTTAAVPSPSNDVTRLPGLLNRPAAPTDGAPAEGVSGGANPPAVAPSLATPGTVSTPPVPDTIETVNEQARLAADKASSRKAVLITPGTPKPDKTPGLKPLKTKHGLVLYNPKKISAAEVQKAAAGEVFDGTVLGLSGAPVTKPSAQVMTTSTPAAPNVQVEVVDDSTNIPEVAAAAQAAVPGGTVEIKSPEQVAAERQPKGVRLVRAAQPTDTMLPHELAGYIQRELGASKEEAEQLKYTLVRARVTNAIETLNNVFGMKITVGFDPTTRTEQGRVLKEGYGNAIVSQTSGGKINVSEELTPLDAEWVAAHEMAHMQWPTSTVSVDVPADVLAALKRAKVLPLKGGLTRQETRGQQERVASAFASWWMRRENPDHADRWPEAPPAVAEFFAKSTARETAAAAQAAVPGGTVEIKSPEQVAAERQPARSIVATGKPHGALVETETDYMEAADVAPLIVRDVNEAQTRQREGNRASDEQQLRIAQGPDINLLGDAPVSTVGAPVVDDVILAGNGRAGGILKGYEANTPGMQGYRDFVVQHAAAAGRPDVAQMKQPVMVRRVKKYVRGERRDFVIESNPKYGALQETVAEAALLDAEALGDLSGLEFTEAGNLTSASLKGVAMKLEAALRGLQRDTDGSVNAQEATKRVQRAALAEMARRANVPIGELTHFMETDVGRRIMAEIVKVAPALAALEPDLALGGPILNAMRIFNQGARAVEKGDFKSVREWAENRHAELITETLSPEANALVDVMVAANQKPTILRTLLAEYLTLATDEQARRTEASQSDDIFGEIRQPVPGQTILARQLAGASDAAAAVSPAGDAESGREGPRVGNPDAPRVDFSRRDVRYDDPQSGRHLPDRIKHKRWTLRDVEKYPNLFSYWKAHGYGYMGEVVSDYDGGGTLVSSRAISVLPDAMLSTNKYSGPKKGALLHSRGGRSTAPVTPKHAAAAVRILRANAPELLRNVTLTTTAELSPNDFHPDDWSSIAGGQSEGFYNRATDTVTILTDNIRPRKGETPISATGRVIAHEVLAHRGLAALRKADPDFSRKWTALMAEIPPEELAALLPLYPHLSEQPDKLAEEWFARHVAEPAAPPELKSLLRRMWDAFKQAVARLFKAFTGGESTLEQRAKELLAAAREALAEEGVTDGQAEIMHSRAIFDPRDAPEWVRKLYSAAPGPFKARNLAMRAMLLGSKLPKGWDGVLQKAGHEVASVLGYTASLGNDMKAAMKAFSTASGQPAERVERMVQLALTNDKVHLIPDTKLRETATAARNWLDTMSDEIARITGGKTGKIIENNIGKWMRRSYLAFDKNAEWNYDAIRKAAAKGKKIHGRDAKAILARAEAYMQAAYPGATPAKIEAMLRDISDRDTVIQSFATPEVNKDVSSLLHRRVIPKVLREFMGEVKDPLANLLASAGFQAQFIARHDQQQKLAEAGLATGLFAREKGGAYNKAVGDPAEHRRSGFYWLDKDGEKQQLWTNPALLAALESSPAVAAEDVGRGFVDLMATLNGFAKANKVALSPDSAGPQWVGNIVSLLLNGDFLWFDGYRNVAEAVRIYQAGKTNLDDVNKSLRDMRRKLLLRMTAAGVTQSMSIDDLRQNLDTAMLRYAEGHKLADHLTGAARGALIGQAAVRMGGIGARAVGAAVGGIAGGIAGDAKARKALNFLAQWVVGHPDRIGKMASFLTNWQAEIAAGRDPETAFQNAAEKTRNTLPTYDKVPKLLRDLSKYGALNTFLAFKHELVRNTIWTVRYAVQELKSGNPALMARGARRLLGTTAVFSALSWGIPALAGLIGKGLGDDEDEKYRKWLAAPWERHSLLNYTAFDKDSASFFNANYLIPQSFFAEIVRAAGEDQPAEALAEKVWQDFVTGAVVLDPILEIATNRKKDSEAKVTTKDGLAGVAEKLDYYMKRVLEPGLTDKIERVWRAAEGKGTGSREFSLAEEALRLAAFRGYTYKHEQRLRNRVGKFNDERNKAKGEADALWWRNAGDDRQRAAAVGNARLEALDAKWREFSADMQSLGLKSVLDKARKEGGFSPGYRVRAGKDGIEAVPR